MIKKLTAVFLAIITLFAVISCSAEKNTAADTAQSGSDAVSQTDTAPETDQYGREIIGSALPVDLQFNGETVTVFLREAASIYDTRGEFIAESENGEVVNDAVYKRNIGVEEKLGVKLAYQISPGYDYTPYAASVRKSYLAGDGAYDIYAMYAYFGVQLSLEGIMYNLKNLPYLDTEKPWWSQNFIDEMTLYGQLYNIVGDLNLTATQSTNAIFFNKNMLADYFGDLDLYSKVYDGKWTIDYFGDLIKNIYEDVNGDAKRDSGDKYGVGLSGVSIPVDAYLDAFDLKITEKDADGIPQLVYNNERTVSAYEKIFNLMHNNNGSQFERATLDTYYLMQKKFKNAENLFLIDIFIATSSLRDMNDQYGVLPMFKYDEAQKNYYTNVADVYSLLGVASGTKNPEVTGAVFELLGEKSYDYVTPAYFEIALKRKYTMEDVDANMYDLIRAGTRYNFGFVYSNCMNNMIWLWRGLLDTKKSEFVSSYKAQEKQTQNLLDKIVKKYAELAGL